MNSYRVTMQIGQDTCSTETVVEAESADDAILVAELKWTGTTIRVLDVERADDSKYGFCNVHKDQELEEYCTGGPIYCEACDNE